MYGTLGVEHCGMHQHKRFERRANYIAAKDDANLNRNAMMAEI
jgi:hypothetical protein